MDKNRRHLLVFGRYICCFTVVEFIVLICVLTASIPLATHFLQRSAPATLVNSTEAPTQGPSLAPTTLGPTISPSETPTGSPSKAPTSAPTTLGPTMLPQSPTDAPTQSPSGAPTLGPTETPTGSPTDTPSEVPTLSPTQTPSSSPTDTPTGTPTIGPTQTPTNTPTGAPSFAPTQTPTNTPTVAPTSAPTTLAPTMLPQSPTDAPTQAPTGGPTTLAPTGAPSESPTTTPTTGPTQIPTNSPTTNPTPGPTQIPTNSPTNTPTSGPTQGPTSSPTGAPTNTPTTRPTTAPSEAPTSGPTTLAPTQTPTTAAPTTMAPTATPGLTEFCALNISSPTSNGTSTDTPICWNGTDYCTYPIYINIANGSSYTINNLSQMNTTIQSLFGANYTIDLSNGCFFSINGTFKRSSPYNTSVHGFFDGDFFKTKWTLSSPGSITLPIRQYNYASAGDTISGCYTSGTGTQTLYLDIEWGETGIFQRIAYTTSSTATISHNYTGSGNFTVRIGGKMESWSRLSAQSTTTACASPGTAHSLMTDVLQFGIVVRSHLDFFFETGLPANISAPDAPYSSIVSMDNLFYKTTPSSILLLPMSNWQLQNLQYARRMFKGQSNSLLNATGWTLTSLVNTFSMFEMSSIFISLSNRQFPSLVGANEMFYGIVYSGSVTLDNMYAPNTTTWASAFFQPGATFSSISAANMTIRGDLSNMFKLVFVSGSITMNNLVMPNTMAGSLVSMFQQAQVNGTVNVASWSVPSVTTMANMFFNVRMPAATIVLSAWTSTNLGTTQSLFAGTSFSSRSTFASLNWAGWQTPALTTATNMAFSVQVTGGIFTSNWYSPVMTACSGIFDTAAINGTLDTYNWTTGACGTMATLFQQINFIGISPVGYVCSSGPDISTWSFSSVTTLLSFGFAANLPNHTITLANKNAPLLTTMLVGFQSFTGAGFDFSGFQTPNLTTISGLFNVPSGSCPTCVVNGSINLNNWYAPKLITLTQTFLNTIVTGSVNMVNFTFSIDNPVTMSQMFNTANFGSGPIINGWNVKAVTNINNMFLGFTASSGYSSIFNWTGLSFSNLTGFAAATGCLPIGTKVSTQNFDIFLFVMANTSTTTNNVIGVTSCYTDNTSFAVLSPGRSWTFNGPTSACVGPAPTSAPT